MHTLQLQAAMTGDTISVPQPGTQRDVTAYITAVYMTKTPPPGSSPVPPRSRLKSSFRKFEGGPRHSEVDSCRATTAGVLMKYKRNGDPPSSLLRGNHRQTQTRRDAKCLDKLERWLLRRTGLYQRSVQFRVRRRGRARSRADADRTGPADPEWPGFCGTLISTLTRKGSRRSREGHRATPRRAASHGRTGGERGAAAAQRRHKWRRGRRKTAQRSRSPAPAVLPASQ